MAEPDDTHEGKIIRLPGKDRLDKEICKALHISREAAKQMIFGGRVSVAGRISRSAAPSAGVSDAGLTRHHPAKKLGSETEIRILGAATAKVSSAPEPISWKPDVIFEDAAIMAVNKPAGMTVHPGAGHEQDTLVDWLRAKGVALARSSDPDRAGLVHRLDKDTSGIILIAKQPAAAEKLMHQFAERQVEKEYRAVVAGAVPKKLLKIVGAIGRNPQDRKTFGIQRGGREAITWIECIDSSGNASFIRVIPKTGRTHQIRVHLKHAGFPILGDPIYGRQKIPGVTRMLLHAYRLEFVHPATQKKMDIKAPLPPEFIDSMKALGFRLNPASRA